MMEDHPPSAGPLPEAPSNDGLPPSPEVEPPHWLLWFPVLLFQPRLFFQTFVVRSLPLLTAVTAWLWGTASVMDRMETRILLSSNPQPYYEMLRQSWSFYWGWAAGIGLGSAAFYYFIGGWWYRLRLRWCGAVEPDRHLARRVFVYAAQVFAVPYLLYTAWEASYYPTPKAALMGDDYGAFLIIFCLFWSLYTSYRGVRTAFEVRKWAARVWFVFLPGVLFAVALAGILLAAWTGYLEKTPNLEAPHRIEREGFRLEYPANWEVDQSDVDYDPDLDFAIGPILADAQLQFWFYHDAMDPRECVDQTLENLSQAFEVSVLGEISRWGKFDGAGYEAEAMIDGGMYDVTLFCATEGQQPFEIMWVSAAGVTRRMQPGHDLMRDSLKLLAVD